MTGAAPSGPSSVFPFRGPLRALSLLVAAGVALALGACGGGAPEDSFHRLVLAAPAPLDRPVLPGTVDVGRPAADGLTADRALLYSDRDQPDRIHRYGYHLWTDAPPVLIQQQLVRFLRAARAAPAVVTADLRVLPDYRIDGRLHRFEQIVGPPGTVLVEVELGAVRMSDGKMVHLADYQAEKTVTTNDPDEAVRAYQQALADIFNRFLDDLARAGEGR